jgi:hypothetical protein
MVDSGFYSGIDQPNDRSGVRLLGRNHGGSEPNQNRNSRKRQCLSKLPAIHHADALHNPSITD